MMGGKCQTRLARWGGRAVAKATGEGGVMSELFLRVCRVLPRKGRARVMTKLTPHWDFTTSPVWRDFVSMITVTWQKRRN